MMIQYVYFAFMGLGVICIFAGIAVFCCSRCRQAKVQEPGPVAHQQGMVMDENGNWVAYQDPYYRNPTEQTQPFGTAGSEQRYYMQNGVLYREHHRRERPVTAIVAGRGPHEGQVVQNPHDEGRDGYGEAIEYGEAVYVSQPEGDAKAKSKQVANNGNTTGPHPPPSAP